MAIKSLKRKWKKPEGIEKYTDSNRLCGMMSGENVE